MALSDYSGGSNVAVREENGISHNTERGHSVPSAFSVAQKPGKNGAPLIKKYIFFSTVFFF